jgi:hypothetical protein
MPRATDGTPHHSNSRARLHDELTKSGPSRAGEPAATSEAVGSTMAEAHPPDSSEDIHSVVEQHGPAHTIHSHHDHEAGTHHVSSFHGDHKPGHATGSGFTHHSTHHDVHSAHAHMGHALGMGSAEHEKSESPEYESAEREGAEEAANIPGMK